VSLHDEMLALAPKLRAYAIALTRAGWSDAEDLVQETLMRAWQFRHTFAPGTNLKAWLFRILRNAYLASQAQAQLRTIPDLDGILTSRAAHEPDQEWRLQFGELLEALSKLPQPNREALLLVVGSGLTYEQAAEVCDCSVGTIKSRISRARERLLDLVDTDVVSGCAHPSPPPTVGSTFRRSGVWRAAS
jgi:RNA polymerase sigma-70 factor (ECF subfamily)